MEIVHAEFGIIGKNARVKGFIIPGEIVKVTETIFIVFSVLLPALEIIVECITAPEFPVRCDGHPVFPGITGE